MKKTRFFLMALLLATTLVFTGCGRDDNADGGAMDNQDNHAEQNIKDDADDVKDGAEDLGDDMKEGIDDVTDDVEDALDPDGGDRARLDGRDGSGANDAKTSE